MSPEILNRLFTFGFTTKNKRGGSGFGLHSSFNLMKAMGGEVRAESPGLMKGATFTVIVPVEPIIESSKGIR
jgi:signal transduction histidine kinase